MRYLKLTLAYDGSNYHGFQRQKNAVGIQQIVEKALSNLFDEEIKVAASGRTDTGVHAHAQVISFATSGTVPTDKIVQAMSSYLPEDIVVWKAEDMAADFNARYSAQAKRYVYRILITETTNPFERNYTWQLKKMPDLSLLQAAADIIIGEHDFSAFRSAGSAPVKTIKNIYKAEWTRIGAQELRFTIEGDGFLYHMVRNLVGAMVRVGNGKITLERFKEILASGDRRQAGTAAPPQGLYLDEVFY